MIQVVERHAIQTKTTYDGQPQISYNSDGRIVIRLKQLSGDTLFCLNRDVSQLLMIFVKNDISKDALLRY